MITGYDRNFRETIKREIDLSATWLSAACPTTQFPDSVKDDRSRSGTPTISDILQVIGGLVVQPLTPSLWTV